MALALLFAFCKTPNTPPSSNSSWAVERLAPNASKNGEWLTAAKLYEQLYSENPKNEELNYETGTNYLKANYPQKALAILTNFDKKQEDKTAEFNGRTARIAKAYYQIGAYEKIEEVVANYDYPKMYRGLAREHLKALIQLSKFEDLSTYFSTYQQDGIFDDKGKKTNSGFLFRAICNELLLVNNAELLKKYAQQYYNWAMTRQEKDKRNLAIATFYQQDLKKAIENLKIAIDTEKSARHRLELVGLLGVCHAQNRDIEKALEQIDTIYKFPTLPNRHDAFGAKYYHQARIQVALNHHSKAIQSLEHALADKAEFWSNRFKEDGLMRDLFNLVSFKRLVKQHSKK